MYKVFNQSQNIFFYAEQEEINKPLVENIIIQQKPPFISFNPEEIRNQKEAISVSCSDVETCFNKAFERFKKIDACGGLILKNNMLLMIKRLGKWDLPKGKLEKGESLKACAIRECEEECGISGLSILKELPSSYHIYPHPKSNKMVLKRTYWYLMETTYNGKLQPQQEEGIEWVGFVPLDELSKKMENSYKNIELCLQNAGLLP